MSFQKLSVSTTFIYSKKACRNEQLFMSCTWMTIIDRLLSFGVRILLLKQNDPKPFTVINYVLGSSSGIKVYVVQF